MIAKVAPVSLALAALLAPAQAQAAQVSQSCTPTFTQGQASCGQSGSSTCVKIVGYIASSTLGQATGVYAFASMKDGSEVSGAVAWLGDDTGSGTRQFSAVVSWPAAGGGSGRMAPVCDVRLGTK